MWLCRMHMVGVDDRRKTPIKKYSDLVPSSSRLRCRCPWMLILLLSAPVFVRTVTYPVFFAPVAAADEMRNSTPPFIQEIHPHKKLLLSIPRCLLLYLKICIIILLGHQRFVAAVERPMRFPEIMVK